MSTSYMQQHSYMLRGYFITLNFRRNADCSVAHGVSNPRNVIKITYPVSTPSSAGVEFRYTHSFVPAIL